MDIYAIDFQFEGENIRAEVTLTDNRIGFKVSSHSLSFVSPGWKIFISSPFPRIPDVAGTSDDPSQKNTRADSPNPIHFREFTENKPEAMLVLIQIGKLQFAKIPKSLPYRTLHGFAVFCDRYVYRKLVRPWLAD